MKKIYKPQIMIFSVLVGVAILLFGGSAFAQVAENNNSADSNRLTTDNLCTRIDATISTYKTRITDRRSTLTNKYSARINTISDRRTNIEERVVSARADAAKEFEEKINQLKSIYGLTEDQLAAIDTFQSNMLSAQTDRQTAVDKARADYRNGLRQIIADRQDELSAAVVTYNTAVDEAFDTAKTNCSSSGALATLRSDLKDAKNALTFARADTQSTTQLRELMETRNTAIQNANVAFADVIKEHNDTLRAALNIESTNDS